MKKYCFYQNKVHLCSTINKQNTHIMKVKITYEERLYYKLEKEVEMTEKEYKNYLKNGASTELQHALSSECCIDNFQEGETIAINFQKI